MTRISVITIGWNNLAGVKRTFASLAGQTYRNVEHIVIDGGSSDGSARWAEENQVFRDTIVASEPDDGIFDAMNKGLRAATGEIVYFLNSGDCMAADDVLHMVASSYEKDHWQWAFGSSQMVDEDFLPTRRPTKSSNYSWIRRTFLGYGLSHQSIFMRTDLLRQCGGFDVRYPVVADCHMLTRVGRVHKPTVWDRTVALTLEGGVSGASTVAIQWEFHRARVDVLGLGQLSTCADACWTGVLILKNCARRGIRSFLGSPDAGRRPECAIELGRP